MDRNGSKIKCAPIIDNHLYFSVSTSCLMNSFFVYQSIQHRLKPDRFFLCLRYILCWPVLSHGHTMPSDVCQLKKNTSVYFLLSPQLRQWLVTSFSVCVYLPSTYLPLPCSGWWRTLGRCQSRTPWSVSRQCSRPTSVRICRSASRSRPSTTNSSAPRLSSRSSSHSRATKVRERV